MKWQYSINMFLDFNYNTVWKMFLLQSIKPENDIKILLIISLVAQMVKCLPVLQETWVLSLGWKDPLEKEMATYSRTLAWKIPWMEELVGYSPWGHKELDTTEQLHWVILTKITISFYIFHTWQYRVCCQVVDSHFFLILLFFLFFWLNKVFVSGSSINLDMVNRRYIMLHCQLSHLFKLLLTLGRHHKSIKNILIEF